MKRAAAARGDVDQRRRVARQRHERAAAVGGEVEAERRDPPREALRPWDMEREQVQAGPPAAGTAYSLIPPRRR
jgi:hypothetical protein